MATHELQDLKTETQIKTKVITLDTGFTKIQVYTHGSTNTLHHNGKDVTAQRSLEEQLVSLTDVHIQRGGNPLMGPMAGRYGNDVDQPLQRVAQPGPEDIHGVFAGLPWEIQAIDDSKQFIELSLKGEDWKDALNMYYYYAAREPDQFSEKRRSLDRLIKATQRRYKGSQEVENLIKSLLSLLKTPDKNLNQLAIAIELLVNLAYPGNANVVRRLTIEDLHNEKVSSFLDEVWFENTSPDTDYRDASGFHTYFNAILSEIVMPEGFWNGSTHDDYDDNLPDVRVRELFQSKGLNRRVFIIPEGELQSASSNQIIYKDPNTAGIREVAIENWRQSGDAYHYPEIARVLKPGESSHIAIRVIVVEGLSVPKQIQDYIDSVDQKLQATEA